MHNDWIYGLAIITIILLFIAAAILAYDDSKRDNSDRVKKQLEPKTHLKLPLDFGALGL